ncbi:uncharacterized protein LOC143174292 isoform X1 [Nomia melanderi]|uniref:uncharacterized protein LOC143174292 isoform X1 n=1 Tax=Nomia melanderi TaxID=2448451 RepID=UPI003FCCE648
MFEKVTPQKAIAFTRLSVSLCCGWPLPLDATNGQVLRHRILRAAAGLSALGLFLPVSYAMVLNYDDAIIFANAASMSLATFQLMLQLLVFGLLQDRFRPLIEDLTASCGNMRTYEKRVFQRYVDKYSKFYGLTVTWFYLCAIMIILGPLLQSTQTFPTISEYPFPVDYMPVKIIIFLHQSVVGFQCSSSVSANVFGGLLLLYTAAKFEILMIDFRAATTVDALTDCLKKYHAATRYAWQVVNGVQYIALGTIIINSVCVVLCGFNLIGKQPIVVKMQLIFLVGTSLLEVLMCAIPADHLMEMSEKVVRGAYEATWYEQGLAVQKTVLHITIPQKPVTITLKCFIPTLNLEYFCSYISSAFSLLTAVRAALSDSDDILPSMSSNNTYMMR